MRRHLSFWQMSELISPIYARLLARIPHGRPLSDLEIAKKSGLSVDRVFLIQHMTDWSSIPLTEAKKFLIGCGVDFCDKKQRDRIKIYFPCYQGKGKTTWKFLRVSPDWETKFKPLLLRALAASKKTS